MQVTWQTKVPTKKIGKKKSNFLEIFFFMFPDFPWPLFSMFSLIFQISENPEGLLPQSLPHPTALTWRAVPTDISAWFKGALKYKHVELMGQIAWLSPGPHWVG